ncbi:MAG: hypothetical protein HQ567_35085 [Candidatus Nealsonbacteria bacterium]|nr:hypothetical protein [Candidatus Nealsonbacteria bacterium]
MSSASEIAVGKQGVPARGGVLRDGPATGQALGSARLGRLGREFLWIGTGQGLAMLGGLVGVRLLTELLGPAVYGTLALGMLVAMLVQKVFLGPLGMTCGRFFSASLEANETAAYLQVVRRLAVVMTGGVLVIAAAGVAVGFGIGKAGWIPFLLVATLFALVSGGNAIFDSVQNAARHRRLAVLHQTAEQWIRFAMAAGLIAVLGADSTVAMLGYVIGATVVFVSQSFFFRSNIVPLCDSSATVTTEVVDRWTRQMRSYTWPFATWGIFVWAVLASDRWALMAFTTASDVGRYAVLFQLGYLPVAMLYGMTMRLLGPVLFSRAGDGTDPARLQKVTSLNARLVIVAGLSTVLAATLAFTFHETIFRLLVASEYREVSWLLPWIVLSGGLFAAGQSSSFSILSGTDTRQLIPAKILTGILGVAASFAGAYYFGIRGVIAGGIFYSSSHLVWVLYLARAQRISLQQSLSTEQVRPQ